MATTQTSKPQIKMNQASAHNGGLNTVLLRNEFYRDKFRMLATTLPLLIITLLISIALNVFLANRKVEKYYFTVDTAGRIIPIRAMNEPYVTEPFLVSWVSEKVASAYSMDPQNYRRQAEALQPNFTDDGYAQYVHSLQDSGTIAFMTKNLLVSTAIAQGTPVVIDRGIDKSSGIYFWKVQVPMLVQYRSALKSADTRRMVTITVVRRETLENPLGIGINQFIAVDM